jgi:hypothetical protein
MLGWGPRKRSRDRPSANLARWAGLRVLAMMRSKSLMIASVSWTLTPARSALATSIQNLLQSNRGDPKGRSLAEIKRLSVRPPTWRPRLTGLNGSRGANPCRSGRFSLRPATSIVALRYCQDRRWPASRPITNDENDSEAKAFGLEVPTSIRVPADEASESNDGVHRGVIGGWRCGRWRRQRRGIIFDS